MGEHNRHHPERKEAIPIDTILIVCGAGASSTFLASRMRALAASRGLALAVKATSDDQLGELLPTADVVLVGPHLADRFESLRTSAEDTGALAALLPADAFAPSGAERALDAAINLLASRGTAPLTEGTPRG